MVRAILLLMLTSCFVRAAAQQFPVFKDRKDSLQYAQITALYFTQGRKPNFDSLRPIESALRQKALGWGNVYKPNPAFTAYADLQDGKINPDNIVRLSISNLKANEVPAAVLTCRNLQELELVNTSIDKIQAALGQLPQLKSLYLFNNVPAGRLILEKNERLSYLRIAGHHPDKLPKSYKNFTALDSLNMNRSMAGRIPNLKKNKELTVLSAVGNNITLKGSKKSKTLQHLDLRMNKVTVVPNSIARKYPSLKALSFNANAVKKVKPGLGNLSELEYLSFYRNGLQQIPAPVYKLKKLQVIDLFDNNIEEISAEIKNLQQLRVLYIANNKLYRLPDEIGQLKNLEEVYVYNNRMDTLPASMDNLEKLKVLWVNDNFFHTIPATTWRVKNMEYLDVSQNNLIQRVPEELGNTRLSTLILSGALLYRETENPELFQKLRQQGTKIIYYTVASEAADDEE